ncbi:hypothetical protein [Streptomyces wedmorensis]
MVATKRRYVLRIIPFAVSMLTGTFVPLAGGTLAHAASPYTGARGSVDIFIHDSDWPDSDDTGSFHIDLPAKFASNSSEEVRWEFERCVDEVRVKVKILAFPKYDGGVNGYGMTQISQTLYEGSSCATVDQDGTSFQQVIGLNSTHTSLIRNEKESDPNAPLRDVDYAKVSYTIIGIV